MPKCLVQKGSIEAGRCPTRYESFVVLPELPRACQALQIAFLLHGTILNCVPMLHPPDELLLDLIGGKVPALLTQHVERFHELMKSLVIASEVIGKLLVRHRGVPALRMFVQ